jgi:predicted ester cyclase
VVMAFKDYSFTTEVGPIVDEDKVAGRWLFRGIYQGGMPGSSPSAVGKRVEYAGIDLFRVDESGKIAEYWLCADILQMLQQVGMIPA